MPDARATQAFFFFDPEPLADRFAGGGVPRPRRLSSELVTMRRTSGLNAALSTNSVWPVSGWPIGLPVAASHSLAVLSQDAVTMTSAAG